MALQTTKYFFRISLPRAVTFAFVSDLHDCDNAPVLDAIEKSGAQAVLVGGDFIHNTQIYRRGLEFLKKSAAAWPTWCCIGNHEMQYCGDIHALVEPTGAILLDNRSIEYGGISVGGLSTGYLSGALQSRNGIPPEPNLKWLTSFSKRPGYKLLLCHHPEYWAPYIQPLPIDLTVSGHAHGGQWRLFGRGLYAPGQGIFPKYTSGLYEGRLLVGRGLGNPHIIPRIHNRPEVILLHFE